MSGASSSSARSSSPKKYERFADVSQTVKLHCPRIRVLVMGRRNAGKTTLLEKMTRSSNGEFLLHNEDGELVNDPNKTFQDKDGNLVNPHTILEPSVERGQAEIDYEITYKNDDDYVFHDSKGMEAGSSDELVVLRNFIQRRQNMKLLMHRLHVIWLCLPVDNDRPLGPQEMAFFDEDWTHGVPVIAIFTKFEWRVTKAYGRLRDAGYTISLAKEKARRKAFSDFAEILQERFANVCQSPVSYVFLQDMDKPSGNGDELTLKTRLAVENEVNPVLFFQIKRNKINIAMSIGLLYVITLAKVKKEFAFGPDNQLKEWTVFLLSLFPYWDNYLNVQHQWNWNFAERQFKLAIKVESDLTAVDAIIKQCSVWIDPSDEQELQVLSFFVDVLIIAENSFWVQDRKPWNHITDVLNQYKKCPQRVSDELRGTVKKLRKEMNSPLYRHSAFGFEGPLQSQSLTTLAVRFGILLSKHRFF